MKKVNYSEPAVLRGIITALVALAAAIGFVIPANLSSAAEALVPVLAFLVPLVQSLWTRQAVVPAEKHVDQLAQVAAGRSGPTV